MLEVGGWAGVLEVGGWAGVLEGMLEVRLECWRLEFWLSWNVGGWTGGFSAEVL